MKRKITALLALTMAVCMLSGCGIVNAAVSLIAPDVTEANDLPHLMVQQIDVSLHPGDADYERHYLGQKNLTTVLQLLRAMATDEIPEEQPELSDGQTYYTVTATYASGEQQIYYLLGYSYLKVGEEPWCEIEFDRAMGFANYLKSHPSDDGSWVPPETTLPPEPVPTETATVPTETTT